MSFQLPAGADFAVEAGAHYPAQDKAERSRDLNLILCTEGAAVVEVNMRTYDVVPRTQIVLGFDSLLRVVGASPNFRCTRMCFSPNFIERMGGRIDMRLMRFLRLNPVEQHSEADYDAVVRHVYALAAALARRAGDPHRGEKMARLLMLYLDDMSDNSYKAWEDLPAESADRPTELFRAFVELVHKHAAAHNDVRFYADRLAITPRYLSQVCRKKKTSPMTIIEGHLLFAAKEMLHHTDDAILDIAMRLNFSDQSVFARFFRRHTGMTPSQWRKVRK